MPLDGTNGGGFGGWGGGDEVPRKPYLPREVASKIRGSEYVLEQLAYAILDRMDDHSPKAQLEKMEINDNVKETVGAMMNALTDAHFYAGCHDPSPHVDFATAELYVEAAVAQINVKVAMSRRVPSLRPKDMTGKIVPAWDETQVNRYPLAGMDRR